MLREHYGPSQGVHAEVVGEFDDSYVSPAENGSPGGLSQLVIIGLRLDHAAQELEQGFLGCTAEDVSAAKAACDNGVYNSGALRQRRRV